MLISFKTVDEILSILKVGFDVNEFFRLSKPYRLL